MQEFTYYITISSRETPFAVNLKTTGSAPSFQGQLFLLKKSGSYANINIPLRSAFHSNSIEKIQNAALCFLQEILPESEIVLFRRSGMGRAVAHIYRHTNAIVLRMRREMPVALVEARADL